MFRLMVGYKKRLQRLDLVALLMKLFVEVLNQAGECLPYGSKYKDGVLYIPEGWKGCSYVHCTCVIGYSKAIKRCILLAFRIIV